MVWPRSVAQRDTFGIIPEVGRSGEDHDAFDEAPQPDEAERDDAQEDGQCDLDNADSRVPQVEAVDAQPAQEDTEEPGNDLGPRLR